MTCREKLEIEHPEYIDNCCAGGCFGCPTAHKYAGKPEYCNNDPSNEKCTRCWDREVEKQ